MKTATALRAERPEPKADVVLTKAVLRVATALDLSHKDVAEVVGVSGATVSRLAAGERTLDPESKEGELALLLVRVFRSLDALLGGGEEGMRAWFHAQNAHLGGVPAERARTIEGLVELAQYLDAMRGKL